MRAIITLVYLLAPLTVAAEDVAAVMASLKDEGAECRYMASLCERSRRVATLSHEKSAALRAAMDRHSEAKAALAKAQKKDRPALSSVA